MGVEMKEGETLQSRITLHLCLLVSGHLGLKPREERSDKVTYGNVSQIKSVEQGDHEA